MTADMPDQHLFENNDGTCHTPPRREHPEQERSGMSATWPHSPNSEHEMNHGEEQLGLGF